MELKIAYGTHSNFDMELRVNDVTLIDNPLDVLSNSLLSIDPQYNFLDFREDPENGQELKRKPNSDKSLVEMKINQSHVQKSYTRQVYNILEFVSDIGGLNDGLKLLVFFLSWYLTFAHKLTILKSTFKYLETVDAPSSVKFDFSFFGY